MPHAIATRMSQIWYHAGDITSLFVKGPRTGASAEDVSRSITGLQRGQRGHSSQGIFRRKKKNEPFIFLDEPLPGAPSHVCTKFRANIRRTDCVGPFKNTRNRTH